MAQRLEKNLKDDASPSLLNGEYLGQMVLAAFNAVLAAVKFHQLWSENVEQERIITQTLNLKLTNEVPPTPPADKDSHHHHGNFSAAAEINQCQPHQYNRILSNATDEIINNKSTNPAEDQVREDRERQTGSHQQRLLSATPGPNESRSASQSPYDPSRPSSVQTARQSFSHRVSFSTKSTLPRNGKLASERLTAAHETFLEVLGNFIGIHSLTRTSNEVLVATQQSVNAGRALLTVVEAVWVRGFYQSDDIETTRGSMYAKITDLVHAAELIFQPPSTVENQDFNLEIKKQLADVATSCIRNAGDCMATTRYALETIGDFEFETVEERRSPFDGINFQSDELFSGRDLRSRSDASDLEPPSPKSGPREHFKPGFQKVPLIDTSFSSSTHDSGYPRCVTPPSSRLSTASTLPLPPSLSHSVSSQGDVIPLSPISDTGPSNLHDPGESDLKIGNLTFPRAATTKRRCPRTLVAERFQVTTNLVADGASPHSPLSPTSGAPIRAVHDISTSSGFATDGEVEEAEANVLEKTFAHQIMFNKDGRITGGTLPALIERLTTHDSTPDALFVSTFYLTFRLFATPIAFTQALVDRFEYADDSKHIAVPIKLRVYNVFKGWLESHWRKDCDGPALALIVFFAANQLSASLPAAGKRLVELATRVSESTSPLVPRLVSSIGKTNTSVVQYIPPDTPLPAPIISRSQLGLLKAWKNGNSSPQLLDFDPMELARQLTIKMSRIFCSILPEELLGTEWAKKNGSIAFNVRAMSTLWTDLVNLVADSVLHFEEHSKRAKIIKQWVKIGSKCLELNNYDSLMAIVCSLNSTAILRLRRTWDCVSNKTKTTLENLKGVVDCSRNHTIIRQRLANLMPPCLPFIGIYLTDLTFVDAGNHATRILRGPTPDSSISVINFDKHMMTARIISELQRFQILYRLQEVPELQTWMQDQFIQVRSAEESSAGPIGKLYRRSCLLEPREQVAEGTPATPPTVMGSPGSRVHKREVEFLGIMWKV